MTYPARYTEVLTNILDAGINLFDFEYTSYLPKADLETGFQQYYLFREIGFETIEMFKQRLKVRWTNIIERYNMIFEADVQLLPADAFSDYSEQYNRSQTTSRIIDNTGNSVFNDAPLGEITFDNSHASAITNSTGKSEDKYSETTGEDRQRLSKSKAQAMLDFDKALRDHKREFYNEFADLFFGIY